MIHVDVPSYWNIDPSSNLDTIYGKLLNVIFEERCYCLFCLYNSGNRQVAASPVAYQLYERVLISTIINTDISVHLFLGHVETDLHARWHKVAFCSWKVSKQQYLGK